MKQILRTDFGDVPYSPPYPVRFRKDGWPDGRYRKAPAVVASMSEAMLFRKELWMAGLV